MNQVKEQIFSSTGSAGVTRRPYDRIYGNATRFSSSFDEVGRNVRRVSSIVENHPQISRGVLRGVVSEEVVEAVAGTEFEHLLEVAVPLQEFSQENAYLVYFAQNSASRQQLTSTEQMISATESDVMRSNPLERVRSVVESGLHFSDSIQEDQVDQLHSLWGPTFGWERHEVDALRRRLDGSRTTDPSDRDVWFSAVHDNGTIVSAAMAERLSIPGSEGDLHLVENTEWRTRDEYAGRGLMTATLAMLNSRILSDFRHGGNGLPLIYAECNFQSRSDRAGAGAGLIVPSRERAPQIIVQNVLVNDGQDVPEGSLRDFTFMYMPRDVIESFYDPVQVDTMLRMTRS